MYRQGGACCDLSKLNLSLPRSCIELSDILLVTMIYQWSRAFFSVLLSSQLSHSVAVDLPTWQLQTRGSSPSSWSEVPPKVPSLPPFNSSLHPILIYLFTYCALRNWNWNCRYQIPAIVIQHTQASFSISRTTHGSSPYLCL